MCVCVGETEKQILCMLRGCRGGLVTVRNLHYSGCLFYSYAKALAESSSATLYGNIGVIQMTLYLGAVSVISGLLLQLRPQFRGLSTVSA